MYIYGSPFPPLNKIIKKGYCDFLIPQFWLFKKNALYISHFWLYNSQLQVYISQFWEKKVRIASLYLAVLTLFLRIETLCLAIMTS